MAEKRSWRDGYEEYVESKKNNSEEETGSWRDGYKDYSNYISAEIVGKNVTSKLDEWSKNYNSYITDHQNRYSGRKGTLEDDYVSDSGDWLTSTKERKSALDEEAKSILSYLDEYGGHLDAEWVKEVRKSIKDGLGNQSKILEVAQKDNEYWSQWGGKAADTLSLLPGAENVDFRERAYKNAQKEYGYYNKYQGLSTEDLKWAVDVLEDGKEKEWLTSYAASRDYEDKSKYDVSAGEYELKLLEDELTALQDYYLKGEDYALDHASSNAEYNKALEEWYAKYGGKEAMWELIQNEQKKLEDKKKYIADAKKIQELNAWNSVTGNEDFAQNSQYVSNVEYELFGKPTFTDDTYAYVNNPTVEDKRPLGGGEVSARDLIGTEDAIYKSDTPLRNTESSYEEDALDYMTEDEIAVYNYYYATQGPEKARQYLDLLVDTFKSRKNADTYEKTAEYANKHPWIASALSVGTSIGSGFEYIGDVIDYGADKLTGKDAQMDTNSLAMQTNAIRGTVSDKVSWEIGNWDAGAFLYNTTMSGIDSLASTAFGGAGGVVLGLSAAAQGTNDALERGMSSDQAFWNGLFTGAFEMVFESVSIGNFNKLKEVSPENIKDIFKNLGKSMLVNASEETLTEIANIAYDTLVNGEFANYTLEELENGAWKQALSQVLEAGASGALMGVGMGAVAQTSGYVKNKRADKQAVKQYGDKTDSLIQAGLENDIKSESYKLAQEYKKKSANGQSLTGEEIRNLLAANKEQAVSKIRQTVKQTAIDRLTELGETEDVSKIAELATKKALGEDLSRTEKSVLARSQYGAQVAKEMSTTAYEEAVRENAPDYKSLESRVDTNKPVKVSDTGKAVVRSEGTEIDLTAPKFKEITEDGATLEVDGKTVDAKDIDYDSEERGLAIESIGKIEHITPMAASALYEKLDMSKPVMAQLNGMDEAFTYGYYGYSEADLNAGLFTGNLTKEQLNDAYKLGQYVRQHDVEADEANRVKMRTAAQAEAEKSSATVSKKEKVAKQKARFESDAEVYFMDGKSVTKFDEHTGKYDNKRMAAVNTAKFLSKLGIGGKYYFYESYVNDDGVRVYKDANGNEVEAPNGMYKAADGSIHIDLNAGDMGQGIALFTMGHELGHFVKDQSKKQFKVLGDLITEAFAKTDMSMHERVLAKQKFLEDKRGKKVSYDEAFEEVVCDALSTMLTDGSFYDKLMEIKVKDKDLFATIKRFFQKMIAKFNKAYEELTPDQKDAQDIRDMKDMFDKIQTAFAEALVEASENFQAAQEAQKNTTEEGGVMQEAAQKRSDRIVDQINNNLDKIMALDSVYTIDSSNATPYTADWKTDEKSAHEVFKSQGSAANRPGFGKVILGKKGAVQSIHHGNGPAKQAVFPAIKAVVEQGIEIGRDYNHNGQGFDTVTFSAPIDFFEKKSPLAVVVKTFESANADKTFYIHEICDSEGNYIRLGGEDSNKKTSSTNLVDPTSTVSTADKGISPKTNVSQHDAEVKSESVEAMDVEVDAKTESVAPTVLKSERTWTSSEYVQEREKAAKEIAKAIGVSEQKAKDYIDSVNSIAKMIAEDRSRLDYFSSPGRSSFVSNAEYGGSFDFSTLCKKRRLLTGTFTAIQKALPNTALTADEILDIRNRMKDKGLEVSCGLCYVEGSRANMGQFAKEFLRLYKQYYPDAWQPNMADVNTPDGIEWVRINHPECYEQYEYFWNHYGTLKDGDKNLFASQQKPKLYQLHTEYKGEILKEFKNDDKVEDKNLNGGIRLQSFSDFEIVHLIDTMQIIMDMSRVGLAGQAYTKVPDFAWALGDTGLKINLSLIAKGVDENGKLIFDDVEGMPIAEAMKLRDRYSKNVGTILVAFNDEQLLAAMADDRVDFIIPFHRSQWKKSQYEAMGLPAKTKDYTFMQNEKFIKPTFHEYRGRMVKDKATNYMPNEYWDFSKSGKENAEAYLEMCARNNKRPKFYKFLQNNGDGSYSLKADGSTDGYWKLLIDFKMYDNDGNGSPQTAVKPDFNMDEATRMLNDYSGGHSNFPVAQGIVDGFVNDYKANHKGVKFSERGATKQTNAPTFYSQMAKVVDGVKQEKLGASSVVSMLRGRGVKAEEIKWSGIEEWLDGKKSVTKAELQEFIQGSMLNIEENVLDGTTDRNIEVKRVGFRKIGLFVDGELIETYKNTGVDWESLKDGEYYPSKEYILEWGAYNNGIFTKPKFEQYTLEGGENYREITFNLPDSTYSNTAMRNHWGDNAKGILAHARIQDFKANGKKMLFIEEIQSDWHNEGHKHGYRIEGQKFDTDIYKESGDAFHDFLQSDVMKSVAERLGQSYYEGNVTELISDLFNGNEYAYDDVEYNIDLSSEERAFIDNAIAENTKRQKELKKAPQTTKKDSLAPDAPFKDTYHEFVLKRLLREAAEKGYDSIGWTTADIQRKRWSDEFAEGYHIEYDQEIPKFLKKYGKQWGAEVGRTTLKNGNEVWSMDITDSMKKSVLEEGQTLFQERNIGDTSNRSLLANAFEGLAKSSIEYKLIQKYKGRIRILNEYEAKLDKINEQIHKIRFTKGKYNAERLHILETEAKNLAKEINRNDKELLSLEASEPLRKLIASERKKEAQKTKEHVKEIQQNKKDRAEQTELRHKIRKTVRDLDKLLNRGNKKQNVKEDMKGFVSKALDLADYLFTDHISNDDLIRRGITVRMTQREAALVKETEDILSKLYDNADSLTDEEFTRLDAKRKANEEKLRDLLKAQRNEVQETPVYNLFNDLVIEYASLKNSSQDAVKAAYNDEVERLLRTFLGDENSDRAKTLQNMRVADMTTEELWKLHNAYTMVLTTVRDANKFHVQGMNQTIEQVVGQIAGEFSSRKIPEKKLAIAAQKIANKIGWDYEKLYYALDRIGSDAFTKLIINLADSENIVMRDVIEAMEFRDQIVEKYGFNNWAVNKEIDREFLDNSGKKFKMTLGQMMSLYAYSRREGAWDHIEYGGFVFGETALTNPKPADSYKLSKAQCEAITSLLTKEQKGYVEAMQKFLSETMGAKGNEVSMQLYGIKMFGEKNYFPIHIAGQFKAQANESQAKAAAGFQSMSNAGFTHAQNPNAKAPFVLEGFNEIWSDHVNEMSRYHGTVPALEDIRRVMNRSTYSDSVAESQSIKQLMENHYGKEAVDYFDSLYREANSGAVTDRMQKPLQKLLGFFRKNSVAYSLSVVIQQPSAMSRAYAMIDKKYFGFKGVGALTSGVAKAVSSKWNPAYANAYNEMKKYAPGVTMAKEIGGFDTHTGTSIRQYLLDTGKSFKQSMKTENLKGKGSAVLGLVDDNAIANLPTVADKIAWIEIWNACKRETLAKHKDLAPTSEEFMQIVGNRFTEVIRATQVYDSMFSKSPMLKSKSLAVQYIVSFMNEPNTTVNMVEKAVRDVTKGNWKSGVRTAVAVTSSIIFNNVLKAVIYAMRDDDEDETYIEKYAEAIASGMISDFNPLSYIPYVRDVMSKVQGYDVERPDMAIVTDAIEAYQAIVKNINKDTENLTEYQIAELDKKVTDASWKLVGSLAAFLGIPVKNIYREIDGIIDHARIASANAGMTTLDNVWDKVTASIPLLGTETSKGDKLYEAILNGDQAYIDRLKSTYKDDDAYHAAVRNALRENDPRIREAAMAQINGNPSERVRISKLIKADGFDQDDVVAAINTMINKLTKDDSDSGEKKAKGYYTAMDFVTEYANGDVDSLDAILEDIIDTAMKNGKTQVEAEKAFVSDIKSEAKELYIDGSLDDTTATNLLIEYADMDEEDVASRVNYWAFCKDNPEYDYFNESNVNKYQEFAEPAGIDLDIFAQFVEGTKGLTEIKDEWGDVEKSVRDQKLDVIDSLPLTWQQKDALYLAADLPESKIWDVPW